MLLSGLECPSLHAFLKIMSSRTPPLSGKASVEVSSSYYTLHRTTDHLGSFYHNCKFYSSWDKVSSVDTLFPPPPPTPSASQPKGTDTDCYACCWASVPYSRLNTEPVLTEHMNWINKDFRCMPQMQFRLWKNLIYLRKIKKQKNKSIKNVSVDGFLYYYQWLEQKEIEAMLDSHRKGHLNPQFINSWEVLETGKRASLVAQRLKHLPPMWETWVWSLGREDPLEKEMVTHFTILAWRIPWTEEPGRLQSTGSQRVRHDWAATLFTDSKKSF